MLYDSGGVDIHLGSFGSVSKSGITGSCRDFVFNIFFFKIYLAFPCRCTLRALLATVHIFLPTLVLPFLSPSHLPSLPSSQALGCL